MVAPSTLNTASWVAGMPQITQGFILPSTSTKGPIDENFLKEECKDTFIGLEFFPFITLYIYILYLLSMSWCISPINHSNRYYELKYGWFHLLYENNEIRVDARQTLFDKV